jgi:predicted oxidoreductase
LVDLTPSICSSNSVRPEHVVYNLCASSCGAEAFRGPLAKGVFSGRSLDGQPEHIVKTAALVSELAAVKETTPEAIVLGWLMRHPAMIQPVIGTITRERIAACRDAERQAEQMSRDEWYRLYVSARGAALP